MYTKVSKDLCIGCGLCPAMCPDIYKMDNDGKAVVMKSDVHGHEAVEACEAADSCPTHAISAK